MSKGTVTIHNVMASNDALDDWDIHMVVAIDHHKQEVIDGDISEILLEQRLRRDGWTIIEQENEPFCDLCESPTTDTHRWAALLNHNGGFEMWVCAACVSKHGEDKEDN